MFKYSTSKVQMEKKINVSFQKYTKEVIKTVTIKKD